MIENAAETMENGAETKHLNSTRTARPPRAWQFESIQIVRSSKIYSICNAHVLKIDFMHPTHNAMCHIVR